VGKWENGNHSGLVRSTISFLMTARLVGYDNLPTTPKRVSSL